MVNYEICRCIDGLYRCIMEGEEFSTTYGGAHTDPVECEIAAKRFFKNFGDDVTIINDYR